jgi:hypothetical protein
MSSGSDRAVKLYFSNSFCSFSAAFAAFSSADLNNAVLFPPFLVGFFLDFLTVLFFEIVVYAMVQCVPVGF